MPCGKEEALRFEVHDGFQGAKTFMNNAILSKDQHILCWNVCLSFLLSAGVPTITMMAKVYALHITGLHVMIVGARCQENLGACNSAEWGSTVITLYGCSVVRVSFAARYGRDRFDQVCR